MPPTIRTHYARIRQVLFKEVPDCSLVSNDKRVLPNHPIKEIQEKVAVVLLLLAMIQLEMTGLTTGLALSNKEPSRAKLEGTTARAFMSI